MQNLNSNVKVRLVMFCWSYISSFITLIGLKDILLQMDEEAEVFQNKIIDLEQQLNPNSTIISKVYCALIFCQLVAKEAIF